MLRVTAAAFVVLAAAGCGSHGPPPGDREWTSNARGVATQLRGDVVSIAGLDRVREARTALHDDSALYGLLVAYTDFGGCPHMVAALGSPPRGESPAHAQLGRACSVLQRADALFTHAVARNDPRLLVRATTVAVRSLAPLDRARLALRSKR